ncbi:hypothetical protein GJ496_001478 [Pomphorhynchus laevis]|nr:hypothetical protein GJ496_001478 [Pomphorhynchus laevis]
MQVNRNLIDPSRMNKLQSTWATIIHTAEIRLTRVLWEFYSAAYNSVLAPIDERLQYRLPNSKVNKLNRHFHLAVSSDELCLYPLRRCRRFRTRRHVGQFTPASDGIVNLSHVELNEAQRETISLDTFVMLPPR